MFELYEISDNFPHFKHVWTIINQIWNIKTNLILYLLFICTTLSFLNFKNVDKQWLFINSVYISMISKKTSHMAK